MPSGTVRKMKKNILAPSILSADFMQLGKDIRETVEAGAEYIHFDVMDGMFVPNISFGLPVLKCVKKQVEKDIDAVIDAHLMIVRPELYVEEFAKQGADIITFHYEATADVAGLCRKIRSLGVRSGVSIKPGTPAEALFPYLDVIDMVLVMSVDPGFGGQSFQEGSFVKISAIRKEAERRGLDLDIEVDGGVGVKNTERLIEAGANILVAGSSVFNGDIAENTKNLLALMNK